MSRPLLFTNARLIAPGRVIEPGWLLSRDGRIAGFGGGDPPKYGDAEYIDASGLLLAPGFVDIHVHGGGGHEVMDATPEAIDALSSFYARHGVTGFLATTWTDTRPRILAALENVRACMTRSLPGARLLGAHLEGPYLNVDKCGAQNRDYIRRADRDEALAFLDTGVLRLVALAPEFEANHWLIRECGARGIAVSAAHTSATYDEMRRAVALGLRQTTHTYNAMTGLHHREPGTLGAALSLDELSCEIISDGVHVNLAAVKVLYRAKGRDRTILITDAVRPAGMPDGDYPIDDRVITVRDGAARLPDGTLAGSTLTFDRGIQRFAGAVGEPFEAFWPVTSLSPARAVGLASETGSIEIGKVADLVLLDDALEVRYTVAAGRIVYRAGTL